MTLLGRRGTQILGVLIFAPLLILVIYIVSNHPTYKAHFHLILSKIVIRETIIKHLIVTDHHHHHPPHHPHHHRQHCHHRDHCHHQHLAPQVFKEPGNLGNAISEPGPLYIANLLPAAPDHLQISRFQKVQLSISYSVVYLHQCLHQYIFDHSKLFHMNQFSQGWNWCLGLLSLFGP